jgi:hypothetical protein
MFGADRRARSHPPNRALDPAEGPLDPPHPFMDKTRRRLFFNSLLLLFVRRLLGSREYAPG